MGRKQNEESEVRQREKEKRHQWLQDLRRKVMNRSRWLLTSEILSDVTNGVWLSMQRGFNLNMRTTNSPVTAGLGPIRQWIHGDPGQFKCPECHCRGDEVSVKGRLAGGTMTFPSRDDVRGLNQAFLCASVCVCVFVLLAKVRPEGRAAPQINGVAIAGSVTNTLNWHNRFCGESLSWSEGRLPQLWGFSEFFKETHGSIKSNAFKV